MPFYAASTGGFYNADWHESMPADAVEITEQQRVDLLEGEAQGKIITPDANGQPTLIERVLTTDQLAAAARATRDAFLAASDWTQCRDAPSATASAWAPYRQALRDITSQSGFPQSITWPPPPSST